MYEAVPGTRDEMLDETGSVREHWHTVAARLQELGPEVLALQQRRIARILRAQGTTFQAPSGRDPSWKLDAVPLVVPGAEWDRIARGLDQRARALDSALADLYGPRDLLRRGVLPPASVVANATMLGACRDIRPQRHLVFHSADMVRAPDGAVRVLADRCDAPSGVGYALHDREVLARVYPDLIRANSVRRLSGWLEAVHDALVQLAPVGVEDPRIVLFSGGPRSRTYFEHSYLARTLGYSLVESGDLTVRGGAVWLKSISGLEPVHVVLRRVWSRDADPLELDPDRRSGLPGLVEATRRGTVVAANAIGTAAGSNPALLAHIDDVIREVLGEEPLLQTVPTFWCGDERSLSHVLSHLDEMVLKPVARPDDHPTRFGRLLSAADREALVRRISAEPHLWVGQEEVALPTAPSVGPDGTLVPALTLLRSFSVAAGNGYRVLDGALTRCGPTPDGITIFEGGASKDTWILDRAPLREHGGRPRTDRVRADLRTSVTSRVAQSMFEIGRDLERAESLVRLVTAADRYAEEWPELADDPDSDWNIAVTRALTDVAGPADGRATTRPLDELIRAAVVDADRPRSLVTSLRALLRGSRRVRELFSSDSWRLLSELSEVVDRLAGGGVPGLVIDEASHAIAPLAGVAGLLNESMVRDPGWRFLDAGRRLERSQAGLRLVTATLLDPVGGWSGTPLGELVLLAWDSLGAYRRRHGADIQVATLLDLVLLDPSNPRSVRAAMERLAVDLDAFPPAAASQDRDDIDVAAAVAAGIDALVRTDGAALARVVSGRRQHLAGLVDALGAEMSAVDHAITTNYFTHVRAVALVGQRSRDGVDVEAWTP